MRWLALVVVAGACRINFEPAGSTDDGGGDVAGTVEVIVEGRGIVLASGGDACMTNCTYDAPVTLTPRAAEAWEVAASTAPCAGASPCSPPGGSKITVTFARAPITANRMFVTSTNISPAIGIAGLDAACASAASGLGGTFVAFASTSTTSAQARLAGARGWVRLDGLPLFDTVDQLGVDTLPRAVLYDQMGVATSDGVMTGSTATGLAAMHCSNWTGTGTYSSGSSANAGSFMFGTGQGGCISRRIYCTEIDKNVAVTVYPPPLPVGRTVFLSSQSVVLGNGIASLDGVCASEAAAAALEGTYRALLATTTESAAQRVGGVAGIWRRSDGIAVSYEGLDAIALDAAISLDAMGVASSAIAWLGATTPYAPGSTITTCSDWTSTSNGVVAVGTRVLTNQPFDDTANITCATPARVFCAQLP